MIKLIKRALKFYLRRANETYAWVPSCTIPYVKY